MTMGGSPAGGSPAAASPGAAAAGGSGGKKLRPGSKLGQMRFMQRAAQKTAAAAALQVGLCVPLM